MPRSAVEQTGVEMGLRTAYRQVSQGIRIPYSPSKAGGRFNGGFADLRSRPEDVGRIVEARSSPALRSLLTSLATPGSPWFSLGCDLGSHEEPSAADRQRYVFGGYLHVIASAYASLDASAYRTLAESVEAALRAKVGDRSWQLAFLLQPVELTLDSEVAIACSSLNITFYASGDGPAAAERSREALLRAMKGIMAAADHRCAHTRNKEKRGTFNPNDH